MLISVKSLGTVLYIIALVQSRLAASKTLGISGVKTSEEGKRYFSDGCFLNKAAKSEKFFSPKLRPLASAG